MAHILNVTEAEYHADPCPSPSLSHSLAHTLVTESPRHAWLQHPKLGGVERIATKAMDEGAILHKLLLGAGADFEMVVADDWRTKAAKEERESIQAAGKIAILAHHFEKLKTAAERILKNAENQGFPIYGQPEIAIAFDELGRHSDVACRCRIDLIRPDHILYDLKKVRSANPRDLSRIIFDYGYDIQHMAYTRAYEKLVPDAVGRADFVFLFCETDPPYEVVAARLDGAMREIGQRRWTKAVMLWEKLLTEGSFPWPGYADGAIVLDSPPYIVSRELEEYYS